MKISGAKIVHLDKIKSYKAQDTQKVPEVPKVQGVHQTGQCIFCNSAENLQCFRKQIICLDCFSSIRNLYIDGYFTKEKLTIC